MQFIVIIKPHWDPNTNPPTLSEHEIESSGAGRLEERSKIFDKCVNYACMGGIIKGKL